MTVANQFSDLTNELKELKARMVARGKEVFKEEAVKIFENDPTLESFSWTQYTPYWCDGEPCYFGVNDYLTVEFNDGTEPLEDWDDHSAKYADQQDVTSEQVESANAAHALVSLIPEEVMEDIFGDHVKVTVYKDKIEVDEYDHE
jgi:hypothetical protein